jgi:predicted CXXCH cytochrome family protein
MRFVGVALIALSAAAQENRFFISGEDAGYVDSSACGSCHREIYDRYRHTGMGRSFSRIGAGANVEDFQKNNTYYHGPSDRHYTMYERAGRYYQRRYQIGPDGRERNVVEKEIHFVLGSGNHARTYLHRTADGQLLQLPVGWYAERGGFWAMNPGYDRPDHMDFRRKIDRECFFCHNAYPPVQSDSGQRELKVAGAMPEGIDCQRCHGPGRKHIDLAKRGGQNEAIRRAIVNPVRLNQDRQLELCLQCHLESTSHRLPYSLRRYGRGYFSYRPGERLADYMLHFDRARKTDTEDTFEIAHSAYRLFQSACFRSGKLTCTTCHNPHEESDGTENKERITRICESCHGEALARSVKNGRHIASEDCAGCHMPKRRTDDVVNAVMTDHKIARSRPNGELLAPRREVHDTDENSYKGEVALLYPRLASSSGETALYLDLAQVIDGSNLKAGIARLERSIALLKPQYAEFYFELANAYARTGQKEKAFGWYEQALRKKPGYLPASLGYAAALTRSNRCGEAAGILEMAQRAGQQDSALLSALGSTYLAMGKVGDAVKVLREASTADPELPEIWINLGTALSRNREQGSAIQAMRTAIRLAPDLAEAHNNLANLLSETGDFEQAQQSFREALRINPNYAEAHYNYGRALAAVKMFDFAERELKSALRLSPKFAEAAVSLGLILAAQGDWTQAIEQYRFAVTTKPGLMSAQFNLGLALMRSARHAEAKKRFQAVIQSDPNDYEAHYYLGMISLGEGHVDSAAIHLRKALESANPQLRTAASQAMQRAK